MNILLLLLVTHFSGFNCLYVARIYYCKLVLLHIFTAKGATLRTKRPFPLSTWKMFIFTW
uniref:Uncharacterized protein n=1 Tax=Rhizophora mucronata TaxID=61149 RepID=A0A2P2QPT8_RHIMU